MSALDLILEILWTLLLVIKSITLSIIFTIIPAPRKSVKDEIVLITGAGSGIGQLMCLEFAKRGAIIVAWDINKPGNEQTAEKVKAIGGQVYTYLCDVSKKTEVTKVADQVKRDVGDVSILVNNAGVVSGRNFLDCTDEQLLRTMNVNVLAHFWTIQSFLPAMKDRNHGHIVTIASMAGMIGMCGLAGYCASKFANVGFTESLALELAAEGKDGVKTTTICPYTISTGMFDGAKPRFPLLMPEITPEYASKRIVNCTLRNQIIVCIPRNMYTMAALRGLLPVDATLVLNRFAGGLDFMRSFVGRNKSV